MVLWITGLSGSGKTTLSEAVAQEVRNRGRKIVLLDGDKVRELFDNDLGHDLDGRKLAVERICRLCHFLGGESIDVICSTVLHFPELQDWCRTSLTNYYEIFLDVPIETVIKRDPKGIYDRYSKGELHNVAGLDLPFRRPMAANEVVKNDDSKNDLLSHAPRIANVFFEK